MLVTTWMFTHLVTLRNNKQQAACAVKNHWQRPYGRQSFDLFLIRLVLGQNCVIN